MSEPTFFATPHEFRAWLAVNAADERELLVGFWKRGSGEASITWPESVDEALCFGWIDGVRKSRDAESYTIRFTPRRPGSIWSSVNVARVSELTQAGRMEPAGRAAFERRIEAKTGVYGHEQREKPEFTADELQAVEANAQAVSFLRAQTPSYQRTATWWVVSAKKEETRKRRLTQLIECSAQGRLAPPFIPRRPKTE